MAPPDDRDRGGEDLFEDLDKYFAPIEDADWPAAEDAPPADPDDVVIDLRDSVPSSGVPAPAEASLTQVAAGTSGAADMVASASTGDGGDRGDQSDTGGRELPTSEMSGEDWRRLREVLGEDDEPPEPPAGTGEGDDASATRSAWGPGDDLGQPAATEPPGEHPGGLTLEDLKKAPPEYQDLPAASDEGERPAVTDSLPEPEIAAHVEAPALSEVEAVADRFAESIREETGEHAPVALDESPATPPQETGTNELLWEEGEDDDEGPLPGTTLEDLGSERRAIPDPLGVGTMGGPTWEEPTSRSVLGDLMPPGLSERNLPAAVITAGVLILAAVVSIWVSKAAFAVVASVIVLLAQAELYATMHRRGYQPATALGLVVGAMLLAGAYLRGEQAMLMFLALGAVLSFLWYMAAPPKARDGALRNIAVTLLGIAYVPFLAGYAMILLAQQSMGQGLVLSILGLTFLYDMAAFAVGSFYGKRPLAPTISPKKSWEGLFFGGTLVTLFVGAAVLPNIRPIEPSLPTAIGLSLVIVIFAPLGDLAESLIKRDLRVTDMGTLLPGHGGVLDRIDSALFVLPAAWYFLRLVAS
jgi:phosphatidate cytidylyltransferase